MKAILKASYEEMKAHQERMMAVMKAGLEEIECQLEHQDVPKEEAVMEIIRALEDRYGDHHLAPLTADEMDPGRWWILEKVGCPHTNDRPCCSFIP
jgi:hypothetical protein